MVEVRKDSNRGLRVNQGLIMEIRRVYFDILDEYGEPYRCFITTDRGEVYDPLKSKEPADQEIISRIQKRYTELKKGRKYEGEPDWVPPLIAGSKHARHSDIHWFCSGCFNEIELRVTKVSCGSCGLTYP